MNEYLNTLCTTVREDGLRPDPRFPHCPDPVGCIQAGRCFWREFHGPIPAHQMRSKVPPSAVADLLAEVL